LDPEETSTYQSPPLEINLDGIISNPYIDGSGNEYKVIYPNSSTNMSLRLAEGVGFQDRSSLPPWMLSNQPSSTVTSAFDKPLGFVKAVVLAYAKPSYGKLIEYRLKNSKVDFNTIKFTVDRYEIDNFYSKYFNYNTGSYLKDKEATFDSLPKQIGLLVAQVNYGVETPFDEINGRPVSYIKANGGLDSFLDFHDGETLIFTKQEHFDTKSAYDGWVKYSDLYIGDNIYTTAIEGYGSEGFDQYSVVPGYLEKLQNAETLIGDGVSTSFYLTQIITDPAQVNVYIDGVLVPSSSYNIQNQTLTFNTAPPLSAVVYRDAQIVFFNGLNQQSATGDGVTKSFTLNSSINPPTLVTVNGVAVPNTSYSIFGNVLTFVTAPPKIASAPQNPVITINNKAENKNQRAGVWRISIVNDIVNLIFVQEVQLNDRVLITTGKSNTNAIKVYAVSHDPGDTVPKYQSFILNASQIGTKTTFNNNTTRFFSYRDQYYEPGTQTKYIKFPHYGAFT
jgi:hypothetical protein